MYVTNKSMETSCHVMGWCASDIDECSMSSDMCSHGRCENYMGGYECVCDPGYQSNRQKTGCVGECSTTPV